MSSVARIRTVVVLPAPFGRAGRGPSPLHLEVDAVERADLALPRPVDLDEPLCLDRGQRRATVVTSGQFGEGAVDRRPRPERPSLPRSGARGWVASWDARRARPPGDGDALGRAPRGRLRVGRRPALLPFFVLEFDLSYTATAGLMLAVLASSSFVQPLFGLWSDRRGALAPARPASRSAGVATGLAAVAPTYGLIVVLVFLAASGSPPTTRRAPSSPPTRAAGSARAGMSYFNIGGNTGYALGPIVVTPLVLWLGLTGGLVAMLPCPRRALLLRGCSGLRRRSRRPSARAGGAVRTTCGR